MKRILLIVYIILYLVSISFAEYAVVVTFTPSPDTRTIGHKLYLSDNADMVNPVVIDLGILTSYRVSGLQEGVTYFFGAAAYGYVLLCPSDIGKPINERENLCTESERVSTMDESLKSNILEHIGN